MGYIIYNSLMLMMMMIVKCHGGRAVGGGVVHRGKHV